MSRRARPSGAGPKYRRLRLAWLLLTTLSLVLVACVGSQEAPTNPPATTAPSDALESPLPFSPVEMVNSPLPTPTLVPSLAPLPTATPLPTHTPAPTPAPGQLMILHTNDNWGETEPCG